MSHQNMMECKEYQSLYMRYQVWEFPKLLALYIFDKIYKFARALNDKTFLQALSYPELQLWVSSLNLNRPKLFTNCVIEGVT